jgi:hypothetical protein
MFVFRAEVWNNVKSKEKMGMMYSRDWVTLSDTYARDVLKRKACDRRVAGCNNVEMALAT